MSSPLPRTGRGRAFSMGEDEALCRSWLHASQDPITGNNLRDITFWKKVYEKFKEIKSGFEDRTLCSCQNRWDKIRHASTKYRGHLSQIEHRIISVVINDKIAQAKRLYATAEEKPFAFDHCWEILKGNERWWMLDSEEENINIMPTGSQHAGGTISLDSDNDLTQNDDSVTSPSKNKGKRPMGRKAAKEARRKSNVDMSGNAGVISLLENIKSEASEDKARKRDVEDRKMQIMVEAQKREDQKLQNDRERLQMDKVRAEREDEIEDERILNLNTAGMDEEMQKYYRYRKDKVMAKIMARHSPRQ